MIKWQFYSVCPSLPASKHVHTKSDKRGAKQLTIKNEKKSVKEKVSSRKKITVKPKSRQRDQPKKKSRIYQHIRESHGKNHLNDQEKIIRIFIWNYLITNFFHNIYTVSERHCSRNLCFIVLKVTEISEHTPTAPPTSLHVITGKFEWVVH